MSYQPVPVPVDSDTPPPSAPTSAPTQQNEPPKYTQTPLPPQPVFVAAQPAQYVQQQQYMVQPYVGAGGMVMVPPRLPLLPRELQPNDYLVVTLVVTIVCGFLNITSLFFSIPAVICSVMAFERRSTGTYETAKYLGNAAIILNIICVTWVMVWAVITVGLLTACLHGIGGFC